MKRIFLSVVGTVAVVALSGCASSRKQAFDEPRSATVIEFTVPDDGGYSKVRRGINAGFHGVIGGLKQHQEEGGTMHPASVGPATGGLVDKARVAVSDSCARLMVLEFEDDKKRLKIQTRCDKEFSVGQRVSVVRNVASTDPRDILQVVPVQ